MSFVEVDILAKVYGGIKAVDDFSFAVNKGEIYALVGPDGAGKTTTIRSLCNLITPDRGTITINGLNVSQDFNRIKLTLGYMPQIFSLYPDLTVEENLRFYAGIYGVTGKNFLDKTEHLYRFSNLKPFADRRAQNLSGGMKQKLALSCALMHDPELLVLDEPTTGVDPLSRRQFWEILLELKNQGVTIIVSTPYMDEVARADRACFLFDGIKLAEDYTDKLPALFEGKIYFSDSVPSPKTINALNAVTGLRANRFGSGLHIYLEADDNLDNYHQQLSQIGIDLTRLKAINPDLEDCFIQFMEKI